MGQFRFVEEVALADCAVDVEGRDLGDLFETAAAADVAPPPDAYDPEIARLVGSISKERLEATVRTLAGFGTRHSLSATDDPARAWRLLKAAERGSKATAFSNRAAAFSFSPRSIQYQPYKS